MREKKFQIVLLCYFITYEMLLRYAAPYEKNAIPCYKLESIFVFIHFADDKSSQYYR